VAHQEKLQTTDDKQRVIVC